jgi:hypothetical protein
MRMHIRVNSSLVLVRLLSWQLRLLRMRLLDYYWLDWLLMYRASLVNSIWTWQLSLVTKVLRILLLLWSSWLEFFFAVLSLHIGSSLSGCLNTSWFRRLGLLLVLRQVFYITRVEVRLVLILFLFILVSLGLFLVQNLICCSLSGEPIASP